MGVMRTLAGPQYLENRSNQFGNASSVKAAA